MNGKMRSDFKMSDSLNSGNVYVWKFGATYIRGMTVEVNSRMLRILQK